MVPSALSKARWDEGDVDGFQLLGAGQKLQGAVAQLEAVEVFEAHLSALSRGEQLQEFDWQPGEMTANPPEFLRYTQATGPGI
jgi:hypothetical protein